MRGGFFSAMEGSFRRWRPILAERTAKASPKSNKYSQEHSFSFMLDSFSCKKSMSGTAAPNGTCSQASRMIPEADGAGSSLRQTRCRLVFTISLATSKNRGHPCPLTQTRSSSSSRPSFTWSTITAIKRGRHPRQAETNAAGRPEQRARPRRKTSAHAFLVSKKWEAVHSGGAFCFAQPTIAW